MIDVETALGDIPHFETFCSVDKLHALVATLSADPRFDVRVAGTSVNGVPIHHVRFGRGKVKALFVAFPHPMEPIGGMTVFSLMTLLKQGHRALLEAEVEWNIVPCIDPDGAILNEPWSQDFSIEKYLRNYYLQSARDQADMSFAISYKKLVVDRPSREAAVLKSVIDACLPDFYTTLHNTRVGGAFYLLSHDIDHKYHRQLYRLLEQQQFPLQTRPPWKEVGARYGEGIGEVLFTRKIYDYLEQTTPSPEKYELIRYGAESWDYMAEIKPEALTFVPEMGCLRHPFDESERATGIDLRWFKLRIDADSKYLASVLLQQWQAVKDELDADSPFYRAVLGGTVLPVPEEVVNGGWPMSRYPTRDILFNPKYDRSMTEADLVNVCVVDSGLYFVQWAYQFLRLLRASRPTPRVRQAIALAEQAFDRVRAEIDRYIDVNAFSIAPADTLARVQLGSTLIALNSVLEARCR